MLTLERITKQHEKVISSEDKKMSHAVCSASELMLVALDSKSIFIAISSSIFIEIDS